MRLSISKLLFNLVMATMLAVVAGAFLTLPTVAVGAVIFTMGLIPNGATGLFMPLQQEIWITDIEDNLFEGNEFMTRSKDHSAFVSNAIVHVPQAGTKPTVIKNPTVFPLPISERVDTELTYPIDEFALEPILVKDFDELQTSYAKRASVMDEQNETLRERIATELITIWAPDGDAVRVIETTGPETAQVPPGVTPGTRREVIVADINALRIAMDNDEVPKENRWLLMQNNHFGELFGLDEIISFNRFAGGVAALPSGVIRELLGFNIMTRTTTVLYNRATLAKKPVGAASAADDSFSSIAWHSNMVARAQGTIKMFINEDDATLLGTALNANVPFGGIALRADGRGVYALIQGT